MWINSAQKAAVSPATNRVTSLGIAQINLQTIRPTNPLFKRRKLKACQAAIIDKETSDEEDIDYGDPEINAWVCKGQTLKTESKETIVCWVWEAETGMLVGPEADF